MKSIIKTILIITIVVFAFEFIAKILNLVSTDQFKTLLEKTALIAGVILVLGLVIRLFNKK